MLFCFVVNVNDDMQYLCTWACRFWKWGVLWWPVGFLKKWMWFSVNKLLLWFLFEIIWMCVHTVRKVVTTSQKHDRDLDCVHYHTDTGPCQISRFNHQRIAYQHDCMDHWSVIVWVTVLWSCAVSHDRRCLGSQCRPIRTVWFTLPFI